MICIENILSRSTCFIYRIMYDFTNFRNLFIQVFIESFQIGYSINEIRMM